MEPKHLQQSNLKAELDSSQEIQFVDLLRSELADRTKRNPSYSLRSFASHLGITSSFLSKLLNGKRPLTEKMFIKLSEALGLSSKNFKALKTGSNLSLVGAQNPQSSFYRIDADQFEFISEWFYFAILELLNTDDFKEDPKWIAKRLDIHPVVVTDALERLMRLKFIGRDSANKLILLKKNNTTIGQNVVRLANKKQQQQFLEKAISAMHETPSEFRSQTSVTLAIPLNRLSEAKQLIDNFRREFNQKMQLSDDFDEVYQLVLSFYPLTKNENTKEK